MYRAIDLMSRPFQRHALTTNLKSPTLDTSNTCAALRACHTLSNASLLGRNIEIPINRALLAIALLEPLVGFPEVTTFKLARTLAGHNPLEEVFCRRLTHETFVRA